MSEADNSAPAMADNAEPVQTAETTQTTQQEPSSFTIPEAYQDRGWTKNVKSVDDLFKIHDDAQTLIGKKRIVPDWDNASEKEINDYLSELKPKDGYSSMFPDGTPDDRKESLGKLLDDSGLSKVQADRLIKGYLGMEKTIQESMYDKESFLGILKESFGNDYEKRAGTSAKFIRENLNEADKALLENVPNQYLGLFYRLADNMQKNYGVDESGITGGSVSKGGVDPSQAKKDIRQKMFDLAKKPHTSEEMRDLQSQLDAIYQKEIKK